MERPTNSEIDRAIDFLSLHYRAHNYLRSVHFQWERTGRITNPQVRAILKFADSRY